MATALIAAGTTSPAHGAPDDQPLPLGAGARTDTGPGLYIVTLVDKPTASYDGGVPGLAATRPKPGNRFDRTRPAVSSYEQRLTNRQDSLLARIGNPNVLYRFTTAVNGFAAELNSDQVKELRETPGVALVERATKQQVDTTDSPEFLGADEAWSEVGGADQAGRGTVVGVIDTGIWPENPSFAALPLKRPGRSAQLEGFNGACQRGEQWDGKDCNNKVISARYFVRGFGPQNIAKADFLSPRDGSGHGSHTAATAAGNDEVGVRIEGQDFGQASGMAPGARIAVYKACWTAPNPEDDGCSSVDTVAAIDQAVADGVDVINYSIGGVRDTVADAVELAFLNASAAGVFVAASAGNSGPRIGTVAHPSPWITTVAASTHRLLQGAVVLGDGQSLVGAMVSEKGLPSTPMVLSSRARAAGATEAAARICEIGSLDADVVQDKIVVCDRGTIARVDKSAAVARAGGVGMVLVNVDPASVDADFHSVPTVHVDAADGRVVKEYVNGTEKPTASLDPSGADDTAVPQIAEFSSRGASAASGGDILKPDLTAPGVSVVAAVAPPSNSGRLWDLYSGTSMSSPHVAGLAAVIAAAKPAWSPAQIKSAMMTTAYELEGNAGPFAEGAGHVDPTEFFDAGLVFDITPLEYLQFLTGQGFTYADGSPITDKSLDASDLNLPSIAVGSLTGETTVTRTVTNVSGEPEVLTAQVTGLNGVSASVQPATLNLGAGESGTFEVTFRTDSDAQLGSYAKGRLTWTGLNHDVRMPVVVRPDLVSVPDEVSGTGATGSITVEGVSGTPGSIRLSVAGLAAASPAPVSLVPGPFDPANPTVDEDTVRFPATVPPGTDVARFELDAHKAGDDMDVFVYLGDELVAASATESADETVTLVEPTPGDYTVYVNSFSAANRSTTTGQFFRWVVPSTDAGNLDATPKEVVAGVNQPFRYELSWDGLSMAQRWFGSVRYGESNHRTLVSIR